MTNMLGQILVSIIIGAISAMLTARLALGRFRSQRWWEKKADAYSAIVGSILDVLHANNVYYDELVDGGAVSEEKQFEMQTSYKAVMETLRRHVLLGDFFISEHSSRMLRDLLETLSQASDAEPWLDRLDRSGKTLREALKQFRLIAKQDLEALSS
jgi:hypothetical protein